MRRSAAVLSLLAVFTAGPSALAQERIDCTDPKTTVEMNSCADEDFKAADAKLNSVYQDALAQIAGSDLEKPYDAKSWEEAMRQSQRAWVAFRDADCKGTVPMEWSGGSGTSSAVLGCMTEKTNARIKDLNERYNRDQ